MEASLTGAPIYVTNPDLSEVSVEESSDKDITAGSKVGIISKDSNDMKVILE